MRAGYSILLPVFALFMVSAVSASDSPDGQDLRPIPAGDIAVADDFGPMATCSMYKWYSTALYYANFVHDDEIVIYFEPTDPPPMGCGASAYPFELKSVTFSFNDPGTYQWPIGVDVVIYDAGGGASGGPGSMLMSEYVLCDQSTYRFPNFGTITFTTPICLNGPFFAGIKYNDPGSGPFPSLQFDNPPPVVNDVWMKVANFGCVPGWHECTTCMPVGYPVFTANGEANSPNCPAVTGVCCLWNGTCIDNVLGDPVDDVTCDILSDGTGVFSPGFTCGPNNYPCPLYDGSCCFPDGSCTPCWTADDCDQMTSGAGTFYPGITCNNNVCCDYTCPNGLILSNTVLVGDKDNFAAYDPVVDQTSPDNDLMFWMSHCSAGPITKFDTDVNDKCFGHTFTNAWNITCGCVISAKLCLKIEAGPGQTYNDNLIIKEDGYTVFAINLADLRAYLGGPASWNYGDVLDGCIYLENLPPTAGWPGNILSALHDGDLDIMITDDTKVDYLELTVEICCDICYASGDINGDGISLTVADLVELIQYVYFMGAAPSDLWEADLNGDGYIDQGDIDVYSCYFTGGMSCFTNGYPVQTCCCPRTTRGACCEIDTCNVRAEVNCNGYYQGDNMPCCTPGDADGNGLFNILDVTYLINYLYKGGPPSLPYQICSADVNCDCLINILDVTYMINYLYKGGPAPCTTREWLINCGCPLRK